ncbi:MAG TPA: SAM-dependent methyltransferase, partial [Candidatus Polarisedimenticolia bacterium]|nr:SAM-dependent methyltransferase [Candidatus Polarisedimenticolia bacterium]
LLAYHRHRTHEEFLLRPGEQDLTAHVDFTALKRAAESAGGRTLGLTTQARFLLALGVLDLLPDPRLQDELGRPLAPGASLRRLRNTEAIKELVLPDRMGERFSVLLLGVGDVPADLTGLAEPWSRTSGAALAGPAGPGARPGGRTKREA